MTLITGKSEKMGGFAFLSKWDDKDFALEDFIQSCKKMGLNYKLIITNGSICLLPEKSTQEPLDCWFLFVGKVNANGWIHGDISGNR